MSLLQDILNGNILTHSWIKKQVRIIGLVALLTFVYIYRGYRADFQIKELSALQKELQDVEYTQLTIHTNLTKATRQSHISNTLKANGSSLRENNKPITYIP
mgnify:FL=1